MKVGVISDTHGLLRPEALGALAGVEHILHAGDVTSKQSRPLLDFALRELFLFTQRPQTLPDNHLSMSPSFDCPRLCGCGVTGIVSARWRCVNMPEWARGA